MCRHMEGEEFKFWMHELTKEDSTFEEFYEKLVLSEYFIRYVNPSLVQDRCKDMAQNDFAIVTIKFPK